MNYRKNALVLFTKYPEPGVTKTRLIEENGGALTAEQAAGLYKAMVLDTAEVGLQALDFCRNADREAKFDLYVSTSPEENVAKVEAMFRSAFPQADIGCICDRGKNFDEHFNDSYRQLFAMGYDSVICIGGDLPCITPDLIVRSFNWLTRHDTVTPAGGMVLAPCQAAGVSLVGVTRSAGVDFTGVFYNAGGVSALDALVQIAEGKGIPTALYEALFDVDYMEDLAHIMAVINATAYTAQYQPEIMIPRRTRAMIADMGLVTDTPPNTSHDPRSMIDG